MADPKDNRPGKPYRDFPLFANQNGQWSKKIRGKIRYFGSWREDPKGVDAIQRYLRELPYIQSGDPIPADTSGLTVGDLCHQFIGAKVAAVRAGTLSPRTVAGYQLTAKALVSEFGAERSVQSLRPTDFARLKTAMAEGRSVTALANHIRHARIILKWAFDMDLVEAPAKLGPEFREPSKAMKRKDRTRRKNERGQRAFEREELLILLAILKSSPQLRAMVLLAINCGFGQSDCAELPRSVITRSGKWLDYERVKTSVPRRCPLWPETVEALQVVLNGPMPTPKPGCEDLVFLTRHGQRWARMKETKVGGITKWVTIDSVGLEFGKVLNKISIKREGVNFYSLRRTFQTIADRAGDTVATARIMGHIDTTMSDLYREEFSDARLLEVSNYVRKWLFGR